MSIIDFRRAADMLWTFEPLPEDVFVRVRGEMRSSGPVAIIVGRNHEELDFAAEFRTEALRETCRRIVAGEPGPFDVLPGSGIVVGRGAKPASVAKQTSPAHLPPFGFLSRIPGCFVEIDFGPNGGGGGGGESTTVPTPKQPTLVPSTYGWKPEGDNWVPKADHLETVRQLSESRRAYAAQVEATREAWERGTKLADQAGGLRNDLDELLRENAVLRRTVERLERKKRCTSTK